MLELNRRTATWIVAAFAVGALVAVWIPARRRPEPPAPPTASDERVAAVGAPRACADPPEIAARAARVGDMAKQAAQLRRDNELGHFHPPADLPARFGGGAIEQTLHGSIAAAGVDAEILGTNCDEYPCVTLARTRSAAALQKIKDHFFDQPAYGGDTKQLARARSADPREYRFGATIYPSTDPRADEIHAALTRRLGTARLGPGSLRPDAPPFPPDTIGGPTEVR